MVDFAVSGSKCKPIPGAVLRMHATSRRMPVSRFGINGILHGNANEQAYVVK